MLSFRSHGTQVGSTCIHRIQDRHPAAWRTATDAQFPAWPRGTGETLISRESDIFSAGRNTFEAWLLLQRQMATGDGRPGEPTILAFVPPGATSMVVVQALQKAVRLLMRRLATVGGGIAIA
jgi:hypothetical protein